MHMKSVILQLNERYVDTSTSVPPKTDPMRLWKVNTSRFPKVAMEARKGLCVVPGTSTPSERVFFSLWNRMICQKKFND